LVATAILNPYASRWKARERWPEAQAALRKAGIDHQFVETEGVGHGIEVAHQAAAAGSSPIIVAGGDGTIGEVLNGLYRANPDGTLGPIGVIPLGTANDLVNNLGLPLELEIAAQVIASGKTRRIDLGKANQWVFCNNSAVGLEPVVSQYNIRLVWLRGVIRYLVAALLAIGRKPSWKMRLRWDDGAFEGPVSLVSVGNCPVTGGLFRMAPAADPADGRLTFVHGFAPTRLRMLRLLPRAISGEYVNDPAVHQIHSERISIHTEPETPIQLDGEIRGENLQEINYQILPAKLDIFTV
jgi:diacylglycerol kinase (ATP)